MTLVDNSSAAPAALHTPHAKVLQRQSDTARSWSKYDLLSSQPGKAAAPWLWQTTALQHLQHYQCLMPKCCQGEETKD